MPRPVPSRLLPFLVAATGIALFSIMDAYMKGLAVALGAYNAMLWRLLCGVLMAGAIFFARRHPLPNKSSLALHIRRGTIAAFMATSFFYGIARVPLAEGMALSFIAPLITLYLAAVLLGEKISRAAIIASLLGLAGVVVILSGRLGDGTYNDDTLWGIAAIFMSAILYAYNLILQRQQALVSSPLEVAFFQSLVAGAVLGLAAPMWAVLPPQQYWADIMISAALAIVSLALLSWAYARAEAQFLVSVEYSAFIWAALFGWLFFAERPTWSTIIGAVLIIAGSITAVRAKPAAVGHIEATAV